MKRLAALAALVLGLLLVSQAQAFQLEGSFDGGAVGVPTSDVQCSTDTVVSDHLFYDVRVLANDKVLGVNKRLAGIHKTDADTGGICDGQIILHRTGKPNITGTYTGQETFINDVSSTFVVTVRWPDGTSQKLKGRLHVRGALDDGVIVETLGLWFPSP